MAALLIFIFAMNFESILEPDFETIVKLLGILIIQQCNTPCHAHRPVLATSPAQELISRH